MVLTDLGCRFPGKRLNVLRWRRHSSASKRGELWRHAPRSLYRGWGLGETTGTDCAEWFGAGWHRPRFLKLGVCRAPASLLLTPSIDSFWALLKKIKLEQRFLVLRHAPLFIDWYCADFYWRHDSLSWDVFGSNTVAVVQLWEKLPAGCTFVYGVCS